ncbi:hypothetical protein [Hyphomicrobium sp. CS1GBMeth3]|uniref:hypothetical protein n=1 Tax=Hyphomicrobium sp. CS1GBMeth3 TaxID=1892845 RepID=UPI0009318B8C|nr:hypothetical protein [Hyphomicrobium sp. CS1GBMeth3]
MRNSTLLIVLGLFAVLGAAIVIATQNQPTGTAVSDNEGTHIEAPGTRVDTDRDGTRIQAPGVDITVPRDKAED